MRLRSKLVRRSAVVAAVVAAVAVPLVAAPAGAAPTHNLLDNVAYYTVINPTGHPGSFCRSTTPGSHLLATGGTYSQSRNRAGHGPVSLSVDGATTYATVGFYEPVGTLGGLAGYTVHASGPFGDNLWFDTNTANDNSANGDFFTWTSSDTCLSTPPSDTYALGPSSSATGGNQTQVTVTTASTFFVVGGCTHTGSTTNPVTLGHLQTGYCAGIGPTTQVATWIGITAAKGGTLSATIDAAQLAR